MHRRVSRSLVCLVLMALFGCNKPAETTTTTKTQPQRIKAPGVTVYNLKGIVRRVDQAASEVVIAHEDLPGFMPAMTMPFTLADKTLLDDVRPGDAVEGPYRVEFGQDGKVREARLTDLTVTNPASETPVVTAEANPENSVLKLGDLVPEFFVTTDEGKTLTLSGLKGNVIVLTFIYTRCPLPDFCPAVDAKFAEMARQLAAVPDRPHGVRFLSVSFDPEHDGPAELQAHAKRWGAHAPLWQFAVASHEELRKVAPSLGLSYGSAGREIIHNLCTAVIGPDGKLVRLEVGAKGRAWTPAEMLKTIHDLQAKPGISP